MTDFYYRKLDAYKLAKELTLFVYQLLRGYPSIEHHALCHQMRRAAVSVPSNIAEGMGRMAIRERMHFLEISYGSLAELLCQLEISQSLGYITDEQFKQSEELVTRTATVLSGLRNSLNAKLQP